MATATPPVNTAIPAVKQQFLDVWNAEYPTTLKILRAYPVDKSDLRPHDKAKTARELAWIFVIEQGALSAVLTDTFEMSVTMPPPPATIGEVIAAYEQGHDQVQQILAGMSDEQLLRTVAVPVGPGKMGQVPKIQFAWLMLMDSIHHRGQFSVYLRMSGAKVPSIYGPSLDEPWI
jgi:uncharacterized damage-inducible protein DinB